jgi:hypothetical protein
MSLIGTKRLQQGIFEALASSNRAAGSGGGNGAQPIQRLGLGSNSTAFTTTSATPTVVTGCSVTISLPRTAYLYVMVYSVAKTSGAGGTFAYGAINSDGGVSGFNYTTTGANNMALWDKGTAGYVPNTQWILAPYAPGSHTLDWRISVDAGQTWTNYISMIDVLQLNF